MSLHKFAQEVASKGRGDDSLLIHMTPDEVQRLQAFAEANGRSLTINPDTGLPEAGMLSDLFKTIAPIALGAFLGPAGAAIGGGFMSAGMAGLTVGGLTTLATGSLSRGLMAGMGAYGGAGLGESLMSAGTGSLAATDIAAQQAAGSFPTLAQGATQDQIAKYAADVGVLRDAAVSKAGEAGIMSKASAGLGAIADNPSAYGKDLFKYGSAAAAPIMAGMMVPTTTQMPTGSSNPMQIKQQYWDGRQLRPVGSVDASKWGSKSFSDIYRGYDGGGIVALARGGDVSRMAEGGIAGYAAGGVPDYFLANPDVAKAYAENAGGYATGLTGQQYADLHYATHGKAEMTPDAQGNVARAPTTLSNAAQYALDNNVTNLGLNQGQLTALARNPEMNLSELDVAGTQFGVNTYNPASPLIHGYQVANDQTAAAEAYLADKKNADVLAYLNSAEGRAYLAANPQFDRADVAYTHFQRFGEDEGRTWGVPKKVTPITPLVLPTTPLTYAPPGTTNPYGNINNPGDLTYNPNGTVTVTPNIPGRPYGGFPGMGAVKDAYTAGGGSLGYTAKAPTTMEEFNARFNKQTGDSAAAYDYLIGKGAGTADAARYPTKSVVGEISRPYDEATLGYPASTNKMYNWDPVARKMVRNFDYVAPGRDANGNVIYNMSLNEVKQSLADSPLQGQALYDWAMLNNLSADDIAVATGRKLSDVYSEFRKASQAAAKKKEDDNTAAANTASTTEVVAGGGGGDAAGGLLQSYAMGGYAVGGGLGSLGSYSDGGRLLKGPGDGVSDSIPATIGAKRQPARLADGEFVIPARIVSELGNGSTDAGAKKLYAMMDRVQRARGKTTGKNKVAANSRADKHLPA